MADSSDVARFGVVGDATNAHQYQIEWTQRALKRGLAVPRKRAALCGLIASTRAAEAAGIIPGYVSARNGVHGNDELAIRDLHLQEDFVITLYDYLPSQNAWKVRQLLRHLAIPHRTETISIFEGAGQSPEYLAINPWGAVPAIRLEDGRVLSESNAILWYFSGGTKYRPDESFGQAKVLQWLSFEADYVQTSVGSLRFWALTSKLSARPASMVEGKRAIALRALGILDRELSNRPFIAGGAYSVADISLFAYAHLANDAGIATERFRSFEAWVARVKSQEGHLTEMYPYSIDPHSSEELP